MSNGDYILGTRNDEAERLGIQHEVWRDRVIDGLQRAGIGEGQTVVDVGAGPGFVSAELSRMVGPSGTVVALERAEHFLAELGRRNLDNLTVQSHDVAAPFPVEQVDACWCRWLLCFVSDPQQVVRNIAAALRPGGIAIFHEYAAYSTWRLIPPDPAQERFRALVEQSWRDSGGEPDIALWLPTLLAEGFEIMEIRTYADIITADDRRWAWPQSFMRTNSARLHELGYLPADEVETMATLLDDRPGGTAMLTPLVAEVIARRR